MDHALDPIQFVPTIASRQVRNTKLLSTPASSTADRSGNNVVSCALVRFIRFVQHQALPHINLLALRYRLLFNAAEIKASYLLINGSLLGCCIATNTEYTRL